MGNSGPLYLAIIPWYEATMTSSVQVQKSPATMSSTCRGPEDITVKENTPANPYGSGNMIPFFTPSQSVTKATKHLQQSPFQVFNQCVSTKTTTCLLQIPHKTKHGEKGT